MMKKITQAFLMMALCCATALTTAQAAPTYYSGQVASEIYPDFYPTREVPPPVADTPADAIEFPDGQYLSPALPPPPGQSIRKYAEDEDGDGPGNFGLVPVHDDRWKYYIVGDRLEYRWSEKPQKLLWDIAAFVGKDYHKLYLESEGVWSRADGVEFSQNELFYSYTMSGFWELRAGARYDIRPDPQRAFAALGLLGMTPGFIMVDTNLYVDDEGNTSIGFEGETDIRLTQRLLLIPRLETTYAFQDVPEYNIGAGFTGIELGARLTYQVTRKFSPYIGVSWENALGETRDIILGNGGDPSSTSFVAGVKFWY